MPNYTNNLNLFKYDIINDAKAAFSITNALNNNWDIIDEMCSPTYQGIVTLSSGTVSLQHQKVLYKYEIPSSTTFTFSTNNLTLTSNTAYTFELLLYMPTVYTLTFPSTVTWQDNTTPTMTSTGTYFFAFRTIDAGSSWKGSLQGVWQ